MKRRLILFFGTFVVLLFGAGLYWLIAGTDRDADSPAERIEEVFATPDQGPRRALPSTEQLLIMARDENGRLEAIYRADAWEKRLDGSYRLEKPSVQLFQRDGQALLIRAREGFIYAEEMAGGVNPRRGSLRGDVEIIYDRAVDPATPIEQRAGDLIRAYMDDVHFDNDLLQVNTDSHVTVFSPEADFLGRGLVIRWNEDPQELRMMRIIEGEYMAFKQVSDMLDLTAATNEGDAPTARTQPAETGLRVADGSHLAEMDELAMTLGERDVVPASRRATAPTSRAVTAPAATATSARPAKRPRRNVFRATFSDRVRVASGGRSLSGAEQLSLVFEWDSRDEDSPLGPRTAARPSVTVTTAPTQPITTQPTAAQAAEITIITWRGPLDLEPIEYTDEPTGERYRVEARGEDLVLSDGRGQTHCSELVYFSTIGPDGRSVQAGRLGGTSEKPVRLEGLGGEQELVCPEARFDRAADLAWLDGPGYIATSQTAGLARDAGETQPSPQTQPAGDASGGRIEWSGSVVARLGSTEVADQAGPPEQRLTVTEAIFADDVRLTSTDAGDSIRSEMLHVWMDEGEAGPYPGKAVASGEVQARQGDRSVDAQRLTVTFEQASAADQTGRERMDLRATSMVAEGAANGTPAKLTQGENTIHGGRILLALDGETAEVPGPGSLAFQSDTDFSGATLDAPRPVKVAWNERMVFRGADNTADVTGRVKLTSEGNSISCDEMTVTFEDAQAAKADGASGDDLAAALGRRRLATVLADGNVDIRSARNDEQGRLLQRLKLTGEQLIYDGRSGQIDCTGYGTLLAEDYRPPEGPRGSGAESAPRAERPRQTAFVWHEQMRLTQTDRSVLMRGRVSMGHRSGRRVVIPESMNVPDWPGVTAGESVTLGCESLLARFAAPETDAPSAGDQGAPGSDLDFGSRVGPIQEFSATGDVDLSDGRYRLVGRTLIYDRTRSLAVLQGDPVARVTYEDSARRRLAPVTSPQIHCYLDEMGRIRKIVVPSVRGFGAR